MNSTARKVAGDIARNVAGDMLVVGGGAAGLTVPTGAAATHSCGRPETCVAMSHQVMLAAADGSAAAIAIHKAFVTHSIGSAQPEVREIHHKGETP